MYRLACLSLVLLVAGCPADEPSSDTTVATPDAEVVQDVASETVADVAPDGAADSIADPGLPDSVADAVADALPDSGDAADAADDVVSDTVVDAGADAAADVDVSPSPGEPWGAISGEACGTLTAALASPDPSFHVTTWAIDVASFDPTLLLDPGPKQRFEEPNAGGSSKCSEIFSMTWLMACEDAEFYKLETQIVYDTTGSITDYEVTVGADKIGVSVTRAYLGPFNTTYTVDNATTLLTDKLTGVNESSANVSAADAWTKQILHIWTLQPDWVPILESVWQGLDAGLKSDTVVLVTIEDGSDFIVTDSCDD